MKTPHNQFAVISFGLGGNSLTGVSADGNPVTRNWYLRGPDEFLTAIPDHYKPDEIDGAYVIDNRDLLSEHPMLAILAPMCNASLADVEIDRFRDIPKIEDFLLLKALSQGNPQQRSLATLALMSVTSQSEEPSPLDFISPASYATWWKKHGARIGILDAFARRIHWDD